ncbi:MAG: ABC transporter ATP-binding protein/permease, partial [Enterobacterales bacterium]|nr:ABC transporter ATP-binding protein/permease [Enterobacterales bacterium]
MAETDKESLIHANRRDWHNLKGILPFLWEFRGRALVALLCLVLAKVANVGVPVYLKEIVDSLDTSSNELLVLPVSLLVAYGALKLSSSLFNELRGVIFAKVRYRAMRRLSTRVLAHLHKLSLRYHLERRTGGISRDLERGTRSVSSILNYLAFSILPIFVEFTLVAFILIGNYDIVFTLAIYGSVVVYIGFTFAISEWRIDHRHKMNTLDSSANGRAIDSLMNYETVKYFNNEAMENDRFDNSLSEWEYWAVKNQTSMSLLNIGQGIIIALGVTLVMFLAVNGVVNGTMTIGDLVLVNALLLQLFIPLGFLGIVYRQIKYSLADMDLVFKLLEKEPEIKDDENATELEISSGHIQFSHVNFAYQPERAILKDVSFDIKGGEKVAVVGHSGAGKSTLSRLLYRFYDIQEGAITIDGQNIAKVSQDSLRQAISIVPQDT